jgi:VWFA-related protein
MPCRRLVLLVATACLLWPQEPDFSSNVDVVTVFATVHDRDGLIAKNLKRDDFVLREDGVAQTIRYFSRESDLPLTVGLLVDTSTSQAYVLEPERSASYKFLDQVLREDTDRAFVAHFDIQVEVSQNFTSSRKALAAALAELQVSRRISTLLYDAIRQCSENQMRPMQGRKAFILLSDGVDYRSKNSLETAIEYAQRADAIIYSILFADPLSPKHPVRSAIDAMVRGRGRRVMRRLAAETGGAFFEVSKDHSLEWIYSQIEDGLRNQYNIGYTPVRPPVRGQYRKIRLTTKQPDLVVQTRDGYYSK